jgi:hypothetical protein
VGLESSSPERSFFARAIFGCESKKRATSRSETEKRALLITIVLPWPGPVSGHIVLMAAEEH